MISDPMAVIVVLAAVVYLAIRLEEEYHLFRSLGSALVAILIALLLSNVGIIPGESPAYVFLVGPGVSVGIVLILISVDVRTVFSAGPAMLGAFALGAVGTIVGAVTGAFLWSGMVGPETWKLSGQFAGTYTGGGVNFAAVGQAVGTSGDLFTAGIAADVIITAFWMAACLTAPLLLGGRRGASITAGPSQGDEADAPDASPDSLHLALFASARPLKLADVAGLVTLGIGTTWAAGWLGQLWTALPSVLWLTTIALLLAQVPAIKRLDGGAMLGNYLVLLFLASNGANSVIARIFEVGPGVFYFAATTVAVHGVVIFGVGRAVGIDAGTLAVASQANVGGPASAIALASARGYADRLLPGVAVGLLGYAAGNYLGLAVARIMQGVLGG
ncbi:MAG: DUF819 family protein [Gemmatimonadota bacterium]|nr:MAG: DUF819 family protein [Gemmatimonadota bacterium]